MDTQISAIFPRYLVLIDLLQKYFFATDLHRFSLISKKFAQIREIRG